MRLKEIKPEMAVHCKNEKEKKMLLEEAERLGYVWYSTKGKPTERSMHSIGCTIHFYDKGTSIYSVDYKHTTHSCQTGDSVIEFSDLIIPDLTAAEAVQWIVLHYEDGVYAEAFGVDCRIEFLLDDMSAEEVVSKIIQWKSDHEKKEPKIETVDICRIIEVLPDGERKCVHEEDIKTDPDLPYGGEQIAVEEILKRYCMEHDGEYIAVHEVVSRVKAVE